MFEIEVPTDYSLPTASFTFYCPILKERYEFFITDDGLYTRLIENFDVEPVATQVLRYPRVCEFYRVLSEYKHNQCVYRLSC